jgi:hypothetical protein
MAIHGVAHVQVVALDVMEVSFKVHSYVAVFKDLIISWRHF